MRETWTRNNDAKQWSQARWVSFLKDCGLISQKTYSKDCHQVTEIWVELWNKK